MKNEMINNYFVIEKIQPNYSLNPALINNITQPGLPNFFTGELRIIKTSLAQNSDLQ
jgi:hypothetical protein